MAFDSTHQTCLAAELDAENGLPKAQREGAILVVVDSANFDKYISHQGKWYGPLV